MDEERHDQPEGQQPPPETPPQAAGEPPMNPAPAPRQNNLAVASFVLAIVGIVTCAGLPLFGLFSLILGLIALAQIARNPEQAGSKWMAIVGIVTGGVGILVIPIIVAILFPVFVRAKEAGQQSACIKNVKQISVALQMYTTDYEQYPPADRWVQALDPYMGRLSKARDTFRCPAAKSALPSYALNRRVAGIREADISDPAATVTVFDSIPGRSPAGGVELLPAPPRHHSRHVIGFADGHVMSVAASQVSGLMWDPFSKPPKTLPIPETEEKKSPFG